MSIELRKAAQDAAEAIDWLLKNIRLDAPQLSGKAMGNAEKCASALRAAIQQAEAQQPDTGEPVQADSSGHLRVIAGLGDALRRLSFAAQTTGGTDGPDAELQSAIGQAEQALSLGGIWQAMSATTEPVLVQHRKPVIGWKGETIGYTAWRDGKGLDGWPHRELYDRPAPSVPATTEPVYWEWRHLGNNQFAADFGQWSEWKRVEARSPIFTAEDELRTLRRYIADGYKYELRALYTHPAPSVPGDVVRVPVQVLKDASEAIGNFVSDHGWGDDDMQAMDNLDAYIARHEANRAAMLAAK